MATHLRRAGRTAYTQTITTPVVTVYTYDAANRLTSVNGHTYTWDNNGNLLNDGRKDYTYDAANRLIAVSGQQSAVSFAYNGDGARVRQVINVETITYTLDLAAPLVTVLAEKQATSSKTYLYGLGDSPLASYDGAWRYLSGRDGLNSVRQETDAAGNVIAARSFDPYGVPLGEDGGSPFGFTGEMRDEATGLVFLRARMYQPQLGMFLSPDPWDGNPSRPNTLHRFSYAANNPILLTDPSGRWAEGEDLGTNTNCSFWPPFLGGIELCKLANQDIWSVSSDTRESILDAREQIYYRIAYTCRGTGLCPTVTKMLLHFLEGSGDMVFPLHSHDPLPSDGGILRATKYFRESASSDEPDIVFPLLHDFLVNYMQPSSSIFFTARADLEGDSHYYQGGGKERIRPWNVDYWGAWGHFAVDGSFIATGRQVCSNPYGGSTEGYMINYTAFYSIKDKYEWFPGKRTPLIPLSILNVYIPDAWAKSLADAGRAREFDFKAYWLESEGIFVEKNFTWFMESNVEGPKLIYWGFNGPHP